MLKNRKTLIALIIFIVLIAAAVIVWLRFGPQNDVSEGSKSITVVVVHGDSSSAVFPISTDAEYLGEALIAQGLVEGDMGEFGFFITAVDGEKADDAAQQWWCLTKSGGTVMTGVDMTPIADGDCFELTLTTGYDGSY